MSTVMPVMRKNCERAIIHNTFDPKVELRISKTFDYSNFNTTGMHYCTYNPMLPLFIMIRI